MKLRVVASVMFMAMVLSAAGLFAQDAPKAEEKLPVDVSGVLYLQWADELKNNESAANPHKSNSFSLQRAYLNFNKKIDDVWSARVTTDVENYQDTDKKTRYKLYVKYAYGQAKRDFGPVAGTIQFGMIPTPVIGLIDKISDARWIYQNYIDKAKDLIGKDIDYSADMGVSLQLDIMKMVTVTGMYANGYGYKTTSTENRENIPDSAKGINDDGKSMYGMITVTPIEGLYISGFYRNQDTNNDISKNSITYYGAGAAYAVDFIKAGVNYSLPRINTNDGLGVTTEKKYSLLDSWVNVSLAKLPGGVIPVPLIVYARYATGRDMDDSNSRTTIYGLGLGYEVNKNARFMAYYDSRKVKGNKDADQTFYIKSEVKF